MIAPLGPPLLVVIRPIKTLSHNTTLIKQVMKAVHSDFISKKQRATSIVVSGLRPGADTSDTKLFENLIATNLNMNIVPTSCKRLGALKEDKIQPLLVVLPSVDLTENLFSKVKMLRNSQSEYTGQHVYINRFLTKSEAEAEFEMRQKRRAKESKGKDKSMSGNNNSDKNVSTSTQGIRSAATAVQPAGNQPIK